MSNKSFMCILRSNDGECEKPSPSEMEQVFAKYQAWQEKFADNIVDMGAKLGSVASVVRTDSVTDGPYAELKEIVGGYMMLSAATLKEAVAVIQASPMIESSNVSVEIREVCAHD